MSDESILERLVFGATRVRTATTGGAWHSATDQARVRAAVKTHLMPEVEKMLGLRADILLNHLNEHVGGIYPSGMIRCSCGEWSVVQEEFKVEEHNQHVVETFFSSNNEE